MAAQIKVREPYITPYYSSDEAKEYQLADSEEPDTETHWYDDNDVLHLRLTCDHVDYDWDTTEVDTMRNGEHDTYEVSIAVCSNWECGKVLYIEPDDPNE